jgi:release factor glutamine methyltransferase
VSDAGASVDEARRMLAQMFREARLDSPELDARILTGFALDLDLTQLITAGPRRLDARELEALNQLAERRLAGEPVARILGRKEFFGLTLALSPATLVPRPETESVVEDVLDFLKDTPAPRIADLGTGTGAIMLALLGERPDATGVATDIDEDALRVAEENAAAYRLTRRVAFVHCDFAEGLTGEFDAIVSNPPYIARADIASLAIEVRDHDPKRALDGGPDGLAAYRALIPQAAMRLVAGGALIVEIGAGQAEDVARLMEESGLVIKLPHRRDLAGLERVVRGCFPKGNSHEKP